MAYIEILRLRNSLMWFAGVAAAVLIAVVSSTLGNVQIDGRHDAAVPLGMLLGICGYATMVFATTISADLSKENDGIEMVWTKPVRREALAASYILADLIAIVIAYAIALAVCLIAIEVWTVRLAGKVNLAIVADPKAVGVALLGLGIGFMWYGLVGLVSSRLTGRGGMVVGLSWGLFSVLVLLTHLPPSPLRTLIVALNVLNPLAYLTSLTGTTSGYTMQGYRADSIFTLGIGARAAIAWSIGLLACIATIFSWKRMEV